MSLLCVYKREGVSRKICKEVEDNIIRELASEKQLIDDKAMPVWSYNYSYIRDQIRKKYAQEVSLTTIMEDGVKGVSDQGNICPISSGQRKD